MGYTEVNRVEIIELLRRWQAGESERRLALVMGLARGTVHKYIEEGEAHGLRREGPAATEEQVLAVVRLNGAGPREAKAPTEAILEPWAERIGAWVQRESLQLTRVHELLAQQGCVVSYMSLRRFVGRHGWLKQAKSTVRMADTDPGQVAEMDFGRLGLLEDHTLGRRRVVWALIVVLNYSRHCFVWPLYGQRLEEIIAGLEAAWAFFGGLPHYLVLDNAPAAVAGADQLDPRLTRGFLEYSQRRGFIADPTRTRHPRDKPHVERGVPYVRERFFKGGSFRDLGDVRAQSRHWCLEVAGQRVHGATRCLPLLVFREQEQEKLLPWDGERYDPPCWTEAKVHPDHHIACRYALYSAPYLTCPPGTRVEVRADSQLVRLYHRGGAGEGSFPPAARRALDGS